VRPAYRSYRSISTARDRSQQQTRRPPLLLSIDRTCRQTDGRTLDRFMTLIAHYADRININCCNSLVSIRSMCIVYFIVSVRTLGLVIRMNVYKISTIPFIVYVCRKCRNQVGCHPQIQRTLKPLSSFR